MKIINYLVPPTFAVDNIVNIRKEVQGFFGYDCIGDFVSNLASVGMIIAAIAMFLYLIWGGIEWLTAGGDKQKIENAKKRISNAFIGLAIVGASWAVWLLVLHFFGIEGSICGEDQVVIIL